MALMVALTYGWIALGYEIGKRLFGSKSNLSPALIAGLGTVILSVVGRVVWSIPCIGWLLASTLSMFGLGAIILTRIGTRDYPEVIPQPGKRTSAAVVKQAVLSSFSEPQGDDDNFEDEEKIN